jgi:hypothetical protein
VGAGRAARVAFVVGEGARVADDSPEAWAAAAQQVMSLDAGATPASMMQELCFTLRCLGRDGMAIANALEVHAGRGPTAF